MTAPIRIDGGGMMGPVGGTFRLMFRGETSEPIPYDATEEMVNQVFADLFERANRASQRQPQAWLRARRWQLLNLWRDFLGYWRVGS